MSFSSANIDRAIVLTQFDLRGFYHPTGIRLPFEASPKFLDCTTGNFLKFAAGTAQFQVLTDNPPDYFHSSYEEYFDGCCRLAADCDWAQKEAIQLIIQEILRQHKKMVADAAAGKLNKTEASKYLKPLEKGNRWGKAVLALAEAFEVNLEQPIT